MMMLMQQDWALSFVEYYNVWLRLGLNAKTLARVLVWRMALTTFVNLTGTVVNVFLIIYNVRLFRYALQLLY